VKSRDAQQTAVSSLLARIPPSRNRMLTPYMAKTQVAAVHVPAAHHKGLPAIQRGDRDRYIPTAVTRGGLGCIYTPLPTCG